MQIELGEGSTIEASLIPSGSLQDVKKSITAETAHDIPSWGKDYFAAAGGERKGSCVVKVYDLGSYKEASEGDNQPDSVYQWSAAQSVSKKSESHTASFHGIVEPGVGRLYDQTNDTYRITFSGPWETPRATDPNWILCGGVVCCDPESFPLGESRGIEVKLGPFGSWRGRTTIPSVRQHSPTAGATGSTVLSVPRQAPTETPREIQFPPKSDTPAYIDVKGNHWSENELDSIYAFPPGP